MNKHRVKHVVLLLVLLFVGSLAGCGWLYQTGSGSQETSDISSLELEVPEFEFTNQDGDPFGSSDLEGNVWMANMIFTNCPTVCNTMTPNMMILQQELADQGIDIEIVSFTVDPDFDDPEQLTTYGKNYGVDFANWHFLTGYSDEEITEFAEEAFQSLVMPVPDENDIIHGTSFFLVDDDLQVIHRFNGLEIDIPLITEQIKAVLAEKNE
ncbi:SCO family protein [Desertibacillus haloalkaliphilus]|uniref:SCO family protein n=1 Tax=Desertibacillus haloalkaliphilus TaxID=1328930 RepID=UPI001C263695|nr:SCO family protein [Desertibacillus haloalkaliphilus]MBU8908351.1 SCO family protein [Desertibacillus haloalkaliphilus]